MEYCLLHVVKWVGVRKQQQGYAMTSADLDMVRLLLSVRGSCHLTQKSVAVVRLEYT